MSRTGRFALPLAFVLLTGCSSSKPTQPTPSDVGQAQLQEVWDLYSAYANQYKKPPAKSDDLKPLARGSALGGRGLLDPNIVVLYGTPVGGSNVLAYHKDAETTGGLVLLADGRIETMSADEFKAAPKTGK